MWAIPTWRSPIWRIPTWLTSAHPANTHTANTYTGNPYIELLVTRGDPFITTRGYQWLNKLFQTKVTIWTDLVEYIAVDLPPMEICANSFHLHTT